MIRTIVYIGVCIGAVYETTRTYSLSLKGQSVRLLRQLEGFKFLGVGRTGLKARHSTSQRSSNRSACAQESSIEEP